MGRSSFWRCRSAEELPWPAPPGIPGLDEASGKA
jgi:hypothetical protein